MGTEAEFIDKITPDIAALLVGSPSYGHIMCCTVCVVFCSSVHLLPRDFVLLVKSKFEITIMLYPIGRPVRATITLYPIGRPVRATITLYLIHTQV